MVAPVHNIVPKILAEESAKLRWAGREAGDLIFQPLWSNGKKKALDVGGPSSIDWGGNELKKTGARSARARTRCQNPLVFNIDIKKTQIFMLISNLLKKLKKIPYEKSV
jgi:hypothetical protein